MADATRTTRFRFWLWLIALVGVIVPRRLRADWRQECEAELHHRETLLAEWDKLDSSHKLDLLWRSTSAFWDALWLQPIRLEDDMFQNLRYGIRRNAAPSAIVWHLAKPSKLTSGQCNNGLNSFSLLANTSLTLAVSFNPRERQEPLRVASATKAL